MITILGTGHVFRIHEQVSFIVKNSWPEAVLVELDPQRLRSMRSPPGKEEAKAPWFYRMMAQQQLRLADEFGSEVGSDMLAAVEAAEKAGAELVLIDEYASLAVKKLLERMSGREKVRLLLSSMRGMLSSKKTVEKELGRFSEAEEDYIQDMRRQFPSLMSMLIDERNERMAAKIGSAAARYKDIVVVVGDAHVEGLAESLKDHEVRKIRLRDLLDPVKMEGIRCELWHGEART